MPHRPSPSVLLLLAALWLPACSSTPSDGEPPSRAEVGSEDSGRVEDRFTFERADAARLADLVRGFFSGGTLTLTVVEGRTWLAAGTPDELRVVRLLHQQLDREDLADDLVPRTFLFEDQDGRLLANSARARMTGREDWMILCPDQDHWYTLVPDGDVDALEQLVADLRAGV
jgi:hypothetical protein